MKMKDRIVKLRQKLLEKEIEAILVSQTDNLYYLSGCEGLEGYLLVTGQQAIIATDFRYVEQAQRQSPHCSIFHTSGKIAEWFPRLLASLNIKQMGFESSYLSVASYNQISEIIKNSQSPIDFVPVEGLVNSLRTLKESEEIKFIQESVNITDSVFKYIKTILHPGITEKQLAWEIEKYQREHDSQQVPFELIVAAGANAALPHARPSDYVIKAGEPIIIDIGAKYKYYGSDLTRTLYIGEPDSTFQKVYQTVLQAQLTAIAQIKPGMTGSEADAIARNIIAQAGYGEAFGHSLGHGIGLVTHEKPTISPNSNETLTNGMVFTIEPGIYISGWGGVRIEDDVIIENNKLRVLSTAEK
jgi:Xaa-Pro aminopeptidase